jgi:thiol-disulfide isomerase/thioredoxin
MNEENKQQSAGENLQKPDNDKKQPLKKRILGWLGYLAVLAAILFFFAPESWWQFGVAPHAERKTGANFILKDMNGADWNFGDKRGKVVVVNYWATWCPPCRVETPGLVNVADEYRERGVEMVGVTLDENLADVPPFVEKYRIKYPILLPGADPNLSPEGMALPTTFLYDKNGNLAKKYTGIVLESTLKSDIEILLGE